jgi:hypothetical protein
MNYETVIKTFLKLFLVLGILIPGTGYLASAEPCASSPPFSRVLSFDRQANGQMLTLHDCNGDGVVDRRTLWTVVEFMADPVACADPYDPRHLLVPRSGYYRLLAEPVRIESLQGSEPEGARGFRSFREGGRW